MRGFPSIDRYDTEGLLTTPCFSWILRCMWSWAEMDSSISVPVCELMGRCAGSQQESLTGISVSAKRHKEQQRWCLVRDAEERLWRPLHPAEVGSRDGRYSGWRHSECWVLLAWAEILNSGKWGGLEKHSQVTGGNLVFWVIGLWRIHLLGQSSL